MEKKIKYLVCLLAILQALSCSEVEDRLVVSSPDDRVDLVLEMDDQLRYSVLKDGDTLVIPSAISMCFDNGRTIGEKVRPLTVLLGKDSTDLPAPFYRQSQVKSAWNYAVIEFEGNWSLEVRAFNEGIAWRLLTDFEEPQVQVLDEVTEFKFPEDPLVWLAYSKGEDPFSNAFQNVYSHEKISEFGSSSSLAMLPIAVESGGQRKVTIGESDLRSYPGMFLEGIEGGYRGRFAGLPDSTYLETYRNQKIVASRQEILARTEGSRSYPWRILSISDEDKEMLDNDLVYLLAEPSRLEDISWIRPGLSAWEWWNDCGLKHTWFHPGVNTRTYKAYIDFAAEYGLPYIIMDEGWSMKHSLMEVNPTVDLPEIVEYARDKQVGIFLWAVANVLEGQMEEVFSHYSAMGIKGFKVDFFNRDDQECVDLVYRLAEKAADHHLMLDFHGIYKPTGLNRTYPNILNFEAVYGLEEVKWSHPDMPSYDVTFPFIRMAQGPVDYTQGAFRNATRKGFKIDYHEPMSQGTRTHQVAAYVVFDSPLAMLCDSPDLYEKEPECTRFLSELPTVYDSYQILEGEVGEYLVVLRELEGKYYVGALTNWEKRELEIPLSFLDASARYEVKVMKDIASSERRPEKYQLGSDVATSEDLLKIEMAPGGGFVAVFQLKEHN